MSYLRYLCLFAHSGVQHILCCFPSSCVPYDVSFSGLSFLIALSVLPSKTTDTSARCRPNAMNDNFMNIDPDLHHIFILFK